MTIVYEDLDLPAGATPYPLDVRVRLAGAAGRPVLGKVVSTGKRIMGEQVLTLGDGISDAGLWSLDLPGNDDILPPGTTWYVRRQVGCEVEISYLNVPVTGGPFEAFTREDDPLGTITPSALSAHAADVDLHGGGIIIDRKVVTTSGVVTGSGGGLFCAEVPGTTITIPDLPRPVKVYARIPALQQTGGPAEHSWLLQPSGVPGVFSCLDSVNPAGLNTTTPRLANLFAVLDPHTPGNYVVAATGSSGNLTAKYGPSVLQKLSIWAEPG